MPKNRKSVGTSIDPLELYVTLVAGAENLSVNAARALLRLRRAQLAARDGARGAWVKIEFGSKGRYDLAASAAQSPLLRDFFNLISLELISCFPDKIADLQGLLRIGTGFIGSHGQALKRICASKDVGMLNSGNPVRFGGWHPDWLIVWAAAKPLLEAMGERIVSHRKTGVRGGSNCPVCGGPPYVCVGRRYKCAHCETSWSFTTQVAQLPVVADDLETFDARPLVALVREMASDWSLNAKTVLIRRGVNRSSV